MAAPKGNEFWKQRSKHGRDKLFASSELLWEAACEYFKWCQKNPINDPRSFGGKADIARPFTLQGLCLYLGCNTAYLRQFKADKVKCTLDFSTVITEIEETIYQQKFEHAAVGIYKDNIIARDLGLRDNQDVTTDGEKVNQYNVTLKL
jgi:hypothetical protein